MTRKKVSLALKILIGLSAFLGLILACVFAERDGYSAWYKRLYYFTQMSNVWIGATCLFMVFYNWKNQKVNKVIYCLKFIFTVCIAITGVVYCTLLAPFAGEDYNAWTFGSILSHVLTPVLSVADFFVDDYNANYKKRYVLYSLIPLIFYMAFSLILGAFNVDFGRGDTYPYFFLDFKSEVGFFGYKAGNPPKLGSMYFIILFLFCILGVAYLLFALKNKKKEYKI